MDENHYDEELCLQTYLSIITMIVFMSYGWKPSILSCFLCRSVPLSTITHFIPVVNCLF